MSGAKMLVRMNAFITLEADVGQPRRMRVGRTQITLSSAAQYEFRLGRKQYRTEAVRALAPRRLLAGADHTLCTLYLTRPGPDRRVSSVIPFCVWR
jgi:hypothetical protein